jgi:hypothetical protein
MFEGVLKRLNKIYWYHGMLAISVPILILSLTVELQFPNDLVLLFSNGIIIIGIGEWINHEPTTIVENNYKYTVGSRANTKIGNILSYIGLIILLLGLCYISFTFFRKL